MTSLIGNSRPSKTRRIDVLDHCFQSLHETRALCVYDAIERLVQAGEQAGFSQEDLAQMLDRGMTLASLLDLIEAKIAPQSHAQSLTHQ